MIRSTTILRLPDVMAQCGLSRASIYAFMKAGNFPAQINLGARCVGWDSNSISAWIEARIQETAKARGTK